MCGIVGYLGAGDAPKTLMTLLQRVEYRGYDSGGISTIECGRLETRKAVGRLGCLEQELRKRPVRGTGGIGHTRWATHGFATTANAHPHHIRTVSIVHNGIIENYRQLKERLLTDGYQFKSDTDTETAAVLCQKHLDQGAGPAVAARRTIESLNGAYAMLFLFEGEEDLLFATRNGSPLAVGQDGGEIYVASDDAALAGYSSHATFLEDGDCAVISRGRISVTTRSGDSVDRVPKPIGGKASKPDKDGFDHYMAKEIHEQSTALKVELSNYLDLGARVRLPSDCPDFMEVDRITLIACGTANFACKVAAYWFERLARIPAHADIASEFRYRDSVLDDRTLAIAVSQSGETADTLAALQHAKESGCSNLSVLNNVNSTMARQSASSVNIFAGQEIGVASTKAFTCQLVALAVLAIGAGVRRGAVDDSMEQRLCEELRRLPILVDLVLHGRQQIASIAREVAKHPNAFFIGRDTMYPIALEGALKLKEISYIHAEGLASGELKHGPIALVDDDLPIVVLAPPGPLQVKTLSNLEEVKARSGQVILVSDQATAELYAEDVWFTIPMPDVGSLTAPILYTIPMQLLAYHAAVELGTDVDFPKNLAKSVTVE